MSTKPICLLSIDSESMTTQLDRASYRKMGVKVYHANTFNELQRLLEQQPIDILTLSLDLPQLDALNTIKQLRTASRHVDLPIVITSVRGESALKTKCLQAGANLFVEQPLPRTVYIEKIKTLLEQQIRDQDRIEMGDLRVEVKMGEHSFFCGVTDISLSGLLLSTEESLEPESEVEITVTLPGQRKDTRLTGQVVRKVQSGREGTSQLEGVGIKITRFHADAEKRLEKFVLRSQHKDLQLHYYL